MTELMALITDNSTGEAYHFAALGDGGGAATMNNEDEMVVKGDGRTTYAMIGFDFKGGDPTSKMVMFLRLLSRDNPVFLFLY